VERPNRYQKIIESIFLRHYKKGAREILFNRENIEKAARDLRIRLPKNLGDVIYSFRYRTALPDTIQRRAPKGHEWIIRPAGRGKYKFVAATIATIKPSEMLVETKVPNSTPGIIAMYALNDEQALLAKVRYNRLIDIFSRVTCYSLQSHLRTTVPELGQVETDEIYVGVDRRGAHYVFPVQTKGRNDILSVVQIEQDLAVCRHKFPDLICRPIAAQFMQEELIALFEFQDTQDGIAVVSERHYRFVPPEEFDVRELEAYRERPEDDTETN
jgi:hypothetical protein